MQKGSLPVPLEDVIASLDFLKSCQEPYEEMGHEVNWASLRYCSSL